MVYVSSKGDFLTGSLPLSINVKKNTVVIVHILYPDYSDKGAFYATK